MIRVAFDVHTLGQRATGNETYAQGLMQAFLEQPPADIDFVFYHARSMAEPHPPVGFRRLRPQWPGLRIPLSTPWALYRDRIDLAHFQYFAPPVRICPTILTIHDLSFERYPEFFPVAMALRMRLLMPFQARRASHIIAVSEATRRDIIELYGVAPERVSVVHNGVAQGLCSARGSRACPSRAGAIRYRTPFHRLRRQSVHAQEPASGRARFRTSA